MNTERMTPKEAASFLGLTVSTIYAYTERGILSARKEGNRLSYDRKELERWKKDSEAKKAMGYRERWMRGIPSTAGYRSRGEERK